MRRRRSHVYRVWTAAGLRCASMVSAAMRGGTRGKARLGLAQHMACGHSRHGITGPPCIWTVFAHAPEATRIQFWVKAAPTLDSSSPLLLSWRPQLSSSCGPVRRRSPLVTSRASPGCTGTVSPESPPTYAAVVTAPSLRQIASSSSSSAARAAWRSRSCRAETGGTASFDDSAR